MGPDTNGATTDAPVDDATNTPTRWTARLWLSFISMVILLELLASSYIMLSVALPSISRHFSTNQGV